MLTPGQITMLISFALKIKSNWLRIPQHTMRAAHMKMAKETTAEQAANVANLTALKNFFKGMFGHCSFSLSRNHPVVA